jgi:hypothetical protein
MRGSRVFQEFRAPGGGVPSFDVEGVRYNHRVAESSRAQSGSRRDFPKGAPS